MRLRYLAKLGLEPGCAEFPQCVLGTDLANGKGKMKWEKAENWKLLLWQRKGTAKQASFPKKERGRVTRIPCCLVIQCLQVVLGNYCRLGTFRVVWWVVVEQPSATPEFRLSLSWHVTSFALLWGLSQSWAEKRWKEEMENPQRNFNVNIWTFSPEVSIMTLKKRKKRKKKYWLRKRTTD